MSAPHGLLDDLRDGLLARGTTLEITPDGSTAVRRPAHEHRPLPAPHAAALVESPSLRRGGRSGPPSYEMKFLLTETQAREVEAQLRAELTLDPHSHSALGNGYLITTLYCDTPKFEVFHRQGRHKFSKFRLRRYGESTQVYLERKSKQGTQVRKQRAVIEAETLTHFSHSSHAGDWAGRNYHKHLRRNELQPVCLLEYHRVAYFGQSSLGPVRLTFDRHVRGALTNQWSLTAAGEMPSLLDQQVVCEFKFRGTLPTLFKSAIQAQQLLPRGVSKYRHCLLMAGMTERGNHSHA